MRERGERERERGERERERAREREREERERERIFIGLMTSDRILKASRERVTVLPSPSGTHGCIISQQKADHRVTQNLKSLLLFAPRIGDFGR